MSFFSIVLLFNFGWAASSKVSKNPFVKVKNRPYYFHQDVDGSRSYWTYDDKSKTYREDLLDSNRSWIYDEDGLLQQTLVNNKCDEKAMLYDQHGMESLPVRTYGEDERRVVTAEDESRVPEYRQVGFFVTSGFTKGTAFVTGKNCDILITAAHVSRSRKKGEYSKVAKHKKYFIPDPKKPKERIYTNRLLKSGWSNPKNHPNHKFDFEIYKLESPAYLDRYSRPNCVQLEFKKWNPNKPAKPNCRGRLSLVGYNYEDFDKSVHNRKTPREKRIVENCKAEDTQSSQAKFQISDEEFKHYCDVNNYTSGAPIFCHEGNKVTVVGIHTGSVKDNPVGNKIGDWKAEGNPEDDFSVGLSFWGEIISGIDEEL